MSETTFIPPERYNALGEWKPLIYPTRTAKELDEFTVPISQLTDDEEVEGALLYIRVTGKILIEFVVRTSLRLPNQPYALQPDIYLWACPLPTGTTHNNQNILVYDGWMNLESDSPEVIRESIDRLRQTLHRLTFAFKASITWRLKYLPSHRASGIHEPTADEFRTMDWIFDAPMNKAEARILDAAIDWYNTGSTSANPLTRFLCYFIALESVAIAVTDGDAQFGLTLPGSMAKDLRAARVDCIRELAEQLIDSDPISFATRAYFDCVLSLSKRLRIVLGLVFGPRHPYLELIFSESHGSSLASIRSKLAHGKLTLISPEDDKLIRENLFDMATVVHEFILRLCYLTTPTKPAKYYVPSNQFSLGMSMTDPRTIRILNDPRILPKTNWDIQPEWCDS